MALWQGKRQWEWRSFVGRIFAGGNNGWIRCSLLLAIFRNRCASAPCSLLAPLKSFDILALYKSDYYYYYYYKSVNISAHSYWLARWLALTVLQTKVTRRVAICTNNKSVNCK